MRNPRRPCLHAVTPHDRSWLCLAATVGLLVGLLCTSGAGAEPVVYYSPDDSGNRPFALPNLPTATVVSLPLYMDDPDGSTASASGAVCDTGAGDERCGFSLSIIGQDGVELISFTPTGSVVAGLVADPIPRLRLVGGDALAGELGVVKLGDLRIRGTQESGSVRLEAGSFLDASLAQKRIVKKSLTTVPEPGGGTPWLLGALMLGLLGRWRARASVGSLCRGGRAPLRVEHVLAAMVAGLAVVVASWLSPPVALAVPAGVSCGDIDGDGSLTDADADRLQLALANPSTMPLDGEEQSRCRVSDRSNGCDLVQLAVLRRGIESPSLGPGVSQVCEGGDADGDGVEAIADRCPRNPFGEEALFGGCGFIGLMSRGTEIAEELGDDLSRVRELLAGIPAIPGVPSATPLLDQLALAEASLWSGVRGARANADCTAVVASASLADRQMAQAVALADTMLSFYDDRSPADDWRDIDSEELQLSAVRGRLAGVAARFSGLAAGYATACAQATPVSGDGIVAEFDDAHREIVLEDGTRFWLPQQAAIEGDVSVGSEIAYQGVQSDQSALLLSITGPLDALFADDPECAFLRFAPVQPLDADPVTLHDPEGYRGPLGSYLVEQGVGFAVEEIDCPRQEVGLSHRRQYLDLVIEYTNDQGQLSSLLVAHDLRAVHSPVLLPTSGPTGIDFSQPVILRATTRVKTCTISIAPGGGYALSCGDEGLLAARSYSLSVRERGQRCIASYDETLFDVDDQDPNDFRTAHVQNALVIGAWDDGTSPVFEAEGFGICGGVPCASPGPVGAGQGFAIMNDDFAPIQPVAPGSWKGFFPLIHGVDRAAGLRWPHVTGVNHGLPFRYSCRLPRVVRDVVDFCPGETRDSYFHLPFSMPATTGDDGAWGVAQGNLSDPGCDPDVESCPSHANAYAIDMGRGQCEDEIRAPRAGRVAQVRTGRTCQNTSANNCSSTEAICGSLCCTPSDTLDNGNAIWIEHQDGTFTTYSHLAPGGVLVAAGDLVRRGQLIGLMGTTGYSAGIHLHWETKMPGPITELVSEIGLFQNRTSGGTILTCDEPEQGETLRSNNIPWP